MHVEGAGSSACNSDSDSDSDSDGGGDSDGDSESDRRQSWPEPLERRENQFFARRAFIRVG